MVEHGSSLLPSQVAFKALSDKMLEFATNDRLTVVQFEIETDPEELLRTLQQSSLGDLLLQPGESFSMLKHGYPDLGLIAGKAPPTRVTLAHLDLTDRISSIALVRSVWVREIAINIWFGNKENTAAQRFILCDAARSAGLQQKIARAVYAPEYADTGYYGHNCKVRSVNEVEAMFFVNTARESFEKRVPTARS